jgi:hypothetical protein
MASGPGHNHAWLDPLLFGLGRNRLDHCSPLPWSNGHWPIPQSRLPLPLQSNTEVADIDMKDISYHLSHMA